VRGISPQGLAKVVGVEWYGDQAIKENIPEWLEIDRGRLKHSEAGTEFIHCHAISVWALGAAGKALLDEHPDEISWRASLAGLSNIDWRRTNSEWQGICMLGSDIVTRRQPSLSSGSWVSSRKSPAMCWT
jgi:hypothetical protein